MCVCLGVFVCEREIVCLCVREGWCMYVHVKVDVCACVCASVCLCERVFVREMV